jgi:DNA-binding NarL/FixJ family response regulator
MKKTTIMIIDDHALFRDGWAMLLKSTGKYEIIDKISDSSEIAGLLELKKPDLVLLDINMEPLDGFEVLKIIRNLSPVMKVIIVSMHSQTAYVKNMLKGGANGYVTKSSQGKELLEAVDVVMNGQTYLCDEVKNLLTKEAMGESKAPGLEKLTARELEIIKWLRDGLSSKEIAEKLDITTRTVEVHRHNILKKLNVKNSSALIEFVNAFGL